VNPFEVIGKQKSFNSCVRIFEVYSLFCKVSPKALCVAEGFLQAEQVLQLRVQKLWENRNSFIFFVCNATVWLNSLSTLKTGSMKKNIHGLLLQIIGIICTLLFLLSCTKDKNDSNTRTYTIYSPVYKSKTGVLASINGVSTTAIEHAGKLYIKDNFIYLNEVNKGIHIIDNSNPAHPVQIAFLSIPGNLDIAVKRNILYADM